MALRLSTRAISLLLGASLATSAALAARDSNRVLTRGAVFGPFGQPAEPGTKVLAIGKERPELREDSPLLRFTTKTRAGGRFALGLPAGASFTIWAERADDRGRRFRSHALPSRAAGETTVLCLREEPSLPGHVRMTGLESWRHRGPFTVHAVPVSPFLERTTLVRTQAELFRVPVGEVDFGAIELRDNEDRLLQSWALRASDVSNRTHELALPPPLRVHVRAVDSVSGAPVPGVTVRYFAKHRTRVSTLEPGIQFAQSLTTAPGRTNAQGQVQAEFPWPWPLPTDEETRIQSRSLIARAPDGRIGVTHLHESVVRETKLRFGDDGRPQVEVRLRGEAKAEGRLLGPRGRGISGVRLVRQRFLPVFAKGGEAKTRVPVETELRTDEQGRFAIRGPNRFASKRLWAFLSEQQWRRWAPDLVDDAGAWPLPSRILLWPFRGRPEDGDPKLGDVKAEDFVPLRVRVLAPDGLPARNVYYSVDQGAALPLRLDRKGRATLLLRTENQWLALFDPDVGWFLEQLGKGRTRNAGTPLRATLSSYDSVRCRVVDGKGEPVAWVRISVQAKGERLPRDGKPANPIPSGLYRCKSPRWQVWTNTAGRAELPLIRWRGSFYKLRAERRDRSGASWVSQRVEVTGDSPEEVVFRLSRN